MINLLNEQITVTVTNQKSLGNLDHTDEQMNNQIYMKITPVNVSIHSKSASSYSTSDKVHMSTPLTEKYTQT